MTDATKSAWDELQLPLRADLSELERTGNMDVYTAAKDAQDALKLLKRALVRLGYEDA